MCCRLSVFECLINAVCCSYFKTKRREGCLEVPCVRRTLENEAAGTGHRAGDPLSAGDGKHSSREGPRRQLWRCLTREVEGAQGPPHLPSGPMRRLHAGDGSSHATAPGSASRGRRAASLSSSEHGQEPYTGKQAHVARKSHRACRIPSPDQGRGQSQSDPHGPSIREGWLPRAHTWML